MTGTKCASAAASLLMAGVAGIGLVLPLCARAESGYEAWPELSAFIRLNESARLYLDASVSRSKESNTDSLDASAAFDLSLKPILRPQLWTEDWQRSRYLWARVGYTRVFKVKVDQGAAEVGEDRVFLALSGRMPLPANVWLEGRARTDLRWIGDEYSTRYRLRLDASREFRWLEQTVVPYANAEAFYDTRYDDWSRSLYQVGAEVTASPGFRYELYLARQIDRLPQSQSVNAFGIAAKWYY